MWTKTNRIRSQSHHHMSIASIYAWWHMLLFCVQFKVEVRFNPLIHLEFGPTRCCNAWFFCSHPKASTHKSIINWQCFWYRLLCWYCNLQISLFRLLIAHIYLFICRTCHVGLKFKFCEKLVHLSLLIIIIIVIRCFFVVQWEYCVTLCTCIMVAC